MLQSFVRGWRARKEMVCRQESACIVQAGARGRKVRQLMSIQHSAATHIAAHARGIRSRGEVSRERAASLIALRAGYARKPTRVLCNKIRSIGPLECFGEMSLVGKDARCDAVSYTHLRAHETRHDLVCRLLLEKKN